MNLKNNLTLRYGIALLLVAAILILTHFLSVKQISATSGSGNLIDISGKQRMLSQRIGFLSQGLLLRGRIQDKNISESLQLAIQEMRENHNRLKDDWEKSITRGQTEFYELLAVGALSDKIIVFLSEAQNVHDRYVDKSSASIAQENASYKMIMKAESTEFLGELNAVVKLYANNNQQSSDDLSSLQAVSLFIGLAILFFEAIFIFRPMVSRIVKCIDALDDANGELKDMATSLSDGLQRPIVDSKSLMKVVENSLSSGRVVEATQASQHIYSSMVTMEGIVGDLLDALSKQRKAVQKFTGIGNGK